MGDIDQVMKSLPKILMDESLVMLKSWDAQLSALNGIDISRRIGIGFCLLTIFQLSGFETPMRERAAGCHLKRSVRR